MSGGGWGGRRDDVQAIDKHSIRLIHSHLIAASFSPSCLGFVKKILWAVCRVSEKCLGGVWGLVSDFEYCLGGI